MRMVSWNIQWGRGADGRVDLRRSADDLRRLGGGAGPEVICLQEVASNFAGLPGGAREDEVAFFAEAFPEHEAVFGAAIDARDDEGGRARFGNLILSRLPVDQVFRHALPAPADPGLPSMPRACLEVVVEAPWGWLRVMTTHLEYYSGRQRRAQAEALRELQREIAGRAGSVAGKEGNPAFAARPRPPSAVLCGDFNCTPDSAEHAALCRSPDAALPGWRDAWPLVHGTAAHAPTVGLHGAEWPDRPYCCDYFLVSADLAARVRDLQVDAHSAASDHQPVLLVLGADA
ncbi:endonuclease [Pseudothauera nasutitermitis]|uniref:Endonuclease n=1 Tax=Pseudothauera nasutitermitis TaxID=2565930 RepID=A0A4S4B4E3_9RHOO|nr:endonuclease [Pseudothauera nasutitermitis]